LPPGVTSLEGVVGMVAPDAVLAPSSWSAQWDSVPAQVGAAGAVTLEEWAQNLDAVEKLRLEAEGEEEGESSSNESGSREGSPPRKKQKKDQTGKSRKQSAKENAKAERELQRKREYIVARRLRRQYEEEARTKAKEKAKPPPAEATPCPPESQQPKALTAPPEAKVKIDLPKLAKAAEEERRKLQRERRKNRLIALD